jgi:hypothetical protein
MKVLIFLGLLLLSLSLRTTEEPTVLATTSVSLQDLLDKVKEISNQLAEESLLENTKSVSNESKTEDTSGPKQDI